MPSETGTGFHPAESTYLRVKRAGYSKQIKRTLLVYVHNTFVQSLHFRENRLKHLHMQSEWKSNHVQWIKTSSECGHGTKHLVSCKSSTAFFTESYCYCRDEVWGFALDTRQGSVLAFYLTDLTSEPENTLAHFKTGETVQNRLSTVIKLADDFFFFYLTL